MQLCTARTAWSDSDQAVRAVHSCNSWWLGLLWSDSVIKLVSVLFGKCTTLVATKCWPMETRLPRGDQWKAEKLGDFRRQPITRCFIKSDRVGLFIEHAINFRLNGEHWRAVQSIIGLRCRRRNPEGKRIMPETRFTEFPVLSVDPRVEISRSASETDDWLFFLPLTLKKFVYHPSFISFLPFYVT